MFSGLRQGSTLYILDKSAEPKVVTGYVQKISAPHPMYKTFNPAVSFGTNIQTVVDIVVKIDNEEKEFVGVPSINTIHSYGDYVLCENKEGMISEVDAMMQNSKNILASIDQHKTNIDACEKILKELNPVYAKEQERDEAIESLTEQMNNMQGMLTRLEAMLAKSDSHENNQRL